MGDIDLPPDDPNADTDLPADSGASLGEIVEREEDEDIERGEGKDQHG